MGSCTNCEQPTNNPMFCSRSCSAIYNNKKQPKRKPEHNCKMCNTAITAHHTYCITCIRSIRNNWSTMTIADIHQSAKYQVSAVIRKNARRVYKLSDLPKCCCRCGYEKHYEVCHMRAINDFPMDTPISVVNNINNLRGLCPNCHWEFDHGLLTLSDLFEHPQQESNLP